MMINVQRQQWKTGKKKDISDISVQGAEVQRCKTAK